MAHPTALFGVPAGTGLGSGVSGSVLRARPDGPVYVVEVQLNDRFIALRWEWDLVPPEPGTLIEIAVRPGTLRFFNDSPAPRVRSAESPAVDAERFAALAPRAVAGAEAPGPRTAQPPPPVFEMDLGSVDDSLSPDDRSAEAEVLTPEGTTPSAKTSAAVAETADELSKPQETATPTSDATPRSKVTSETAPPGASDGISFAGTPRLEPAHRTGARPTESAASMPTEPAAPDATDPMRSRPARPTPPTDDPGEETHTSSFDPSPAAAPPPKADDRHSGMPLD